MSFGRNPYVAKAQTAELKAESALDDASRSRAYRDAAHQWDRAAEREKPGKWRDEYLRNAERNRAIADRGSAEAADEAERDDDGAPAAHSASPSAPAGARDRKQLN